MKVSIVCGGQRDILPDDESFIIACDKGYDYCLEYGLKADLVVGDFDSSAQEIPTQNVIVLPHEKDDTDSMYAIKCAIEKGADSIDLYCAMGGRPDHEFAGYQSLAYCLEHGVKCRIVSEKSIIFLCDRECTVEKGKYTYLSVFSWTEKCKGVSISGVQYTLEDAELTQNFPLGVSNEWTGDTAKISVKEGIVLVMCVCKDQFNPNPVQSGSDHFRKLVCESQNLLSGI